MKERLGERLKDGRCPTCGSAMGVGSRCLCPPRPLSREESQAICKQNAERLDKMLADSREKHMHELSDDINELSRLRSYVASVTPLVEAAEEYREAKAGHAAGEIGPDAARTAFNELMSAVWQLEVSRG